MSSENKPRFTLSRDLSFVAILALSLAQKRGHDEIELEDYFGCCYLADPISFLQFWENSLACIDALSIDCSLVDPAWVYQTELAEAFRGEMFKHEHGIAYRYALALEAIFATAARSESNVEVAAPVNLAAFLIAASSEARLSNLFASGFRIELATHEAPRSPVILSLDKSHSI